jgi:hypothetical protein
MKEFLIIPDLHGVDCWKDEISIDNNTHTIFLGNYVDSTDQKPAEVFRNLRKVIEFKKHFPKEVTLLLGNHDVQYMYPSDFTHHHHGHHTELFNVFNKEFIKNKSLFQIAFQYKKHLFTHAGVSSEWYAKHERKFQAFRHEFGEDNIGSVLNLLYNSSDYRILFEESMYQGSNFYNLKNAGGVVCAEREETIQGIIHGYHQIVGHTPVYDIEKHIVNEKTSITYTNCLSNTKKFLRLSL